MGFQLFLNFPLLLQLSLSFSFLLRLVHTHICFVFFATFWYIFGSFFFTTIKSLCRVYTVLVFSFAKGRLWMSFEDQMLFKYCTKASHSLFHISAQVLVSLLCYFVVSPAFTHQHMLCLLPSDVCVCWWQPTPTVVVLERVNRVLLGCFSSSCVCLCFGISVGARTLVYHWDILCYCSAYSWIFGGHALAEWTLYNNIVKLEILYDFVIRWAYLFRSFFFLWSIFTLRRFFRLLPQSACGYVLGQPEKIIKRLSRFVVINISFVNSFFS